ncbi:hypothetical protein LJR153_005071 [Paenibacillus sp. LjRoot153]|uniref:hypothetical protein n=1 Tax=Paenibacillus sp. LjRoot153 TaxID=3342270 RepID=UPI003ECD20FB
MVKLLYCQYLPHGRNLTSSLPAKGVVTFNYSEELKNPLDVTDAEINKEFEQWVWQQVRDYVTWYDKEY